MRLFLVDDHDLFRRGVREVLEEAGGFDVVGEARTVSDSLARISATRPDVALLDVGLPDGSGTSSAVTSVPAFPTSGAS